MYVAPYVGDLLKDMVDNPFRRQQITGINCDRVFEFLL